MKINTYQFRAECEADVNELKALLPGHYVITGEKLSIDGIDVPIPDVTVVLTTLKPFKEVMEMMVRVPSGHVMSETVQPFTKYTGIRLNKGRRL